MQRHHCHRPGLARKTPGKKGKGEEDLKEFSQRASVNWLINDKAGMTFLNRTQPSEGGRGKD